jgi:hypothetical protein
MDTSDGLSPPHGSISTLDGALAKPIRHDRGNHPRFDDSFRPVNAFFDLEFLFTMVNIFSLWQRFWIDREAKNAFPKWSKRQVIWQSVR